MLTKPQLFRNSSLNEAVIEADLLDLPVNNYPQLQLTLDECNNIPTLPVIEFNQTISSKQLTHTPIIKEYINRDLNEFVIEITMF